MNLEEAIECLGSGHSWWKLEYAKEICSQFGLTLPESLIETYKSQKDANPDGYFKGLFFKEDTTFPVSGVSGLPLSDYITYKLIGKTPSGHFSGRGSGARANAEAVAKHFGVEE